MGAYIYTLKAPRHNIKVNIGGKVESVALLNFNYKPTYNMWDGEPRWQILAKARCTRLDNIWQTHGFPKYVCHVSIDDGVIDFVDAQVFEWPVTGASICDETFVYQNRKHIGTLKHKYHNVWELK